MILNIENLASQQAEQNMNRIDVVNLSDRGIIGFDTLSQV